MKKWRFLLAVLGVVSIAQISFAAQYKSTKISTDTEQHLYATIDGNNVYWTTNNGGYYDIMQYNIPTKTVSSTNYNNIPGYYCIQADGGNLVWGVDSAANPDDNGVFQNGVQIVRGQGISCTDIDGKSGNVVYAENDSMNGWMGIDLYQSGTGTTSRLPETNWFFSPSIDGNSVLMKGSDGLYLYNIATGVTPTKGISKNNLFK